MVLYQLVTCCLEAADFLLSISVEMVNAFHKFHKDLLIAGRNPLSKKVEGELSIK